jgi:hypothetical protein
MELEGRRRRDVDTVSRERWITGERAWGDHEPEPVEVELGAWRFELRGDELADVAYDGTTVARSIRAVARDRDWGTVRAVVDSFALRPDGSGADLELTMRGLGADLHAHLAVHADASRLEVRLTVESRTDFASNRLGLVVLHQPELAGVDLEIGTPDGEVRRTTFPVAVSPHQPATDIERLTWSNDGVATKVDFAGEVFEMEDQRNWTDASFKTYSTPLARPFPVVVPEGAVIEQSVAFEARRVAPRASDASTGAATAVSTDVSPVLVELTALDRLAPAVTLGASTVPDDAWSPHPLPDGVAGLLVELDTRTGSWRAALDRARREAADLPLDVRIMADDPDAVRAAVAAAAEAQPVVRLAVFDRREHVTESALWRALADAARRLLPDAELVGGARSHFTELNRRHGDLPADLPAMAFALTPQVHATERAQLVESIGIQSTVARDAARIAGGRPVHVGPVTLRSRFDAVATSAPGDAGDSTLAGGYGAELVSGATDARQRSDALAAWTVASYAAIAAVAEAGDIATVDYFETWGPRGIRDADGPFPVASAVAAIAELHDALLLVPRSTLPAGVRVVGGGWADGSWRVLVVSLAETPLELVVRVAGGDHELTVAPYEVAALDSRG